MGKHSYSETCVQGYIPGSTRYWGTWVLENIDNGKHWGTQSPEKHTVGPEMHGYQGTYAGEGQVLGKIFTEEHEDGPKKICWS